MATSALHRLARLGRPLAQSLAILAIGLCLAEIAMRAYHHFMPVFVFPGEAMNRFRGRPFAPDYDFRLNSHGFKDVEFDPRKRPGTVRILGLGDSFAFGVVPYEHNYLTLVEEDLKLVSPPAEVINMGIASTGPREYLEVLVSEGLGLGADMVLVSFFVGNDFMDALAPKPPPRPYVYTFLKYLLSPKPQGVPIHGNAVYHDGQASWGPGQYLLLAHARCGIFRKSGRVLDEALPRVHEDLAQIKRICDHKGLELLVVLIPDEMQVDPQLREEVVAFFPGAETSFDFLEANRRIGADLQSQGIEYLDLLGPFQEAGRGVRLYKPRDTHWNIAGNRLAADLIRDRLLGGGSRFWYRRPRRTP